MSDKPAFDSDSPMMKRVERIVRARGAGVFGIKIRIPKKGRIRFFLIILLCVALFRVFGSRSPSRDLPPVRADTQKLQPPQEHAAVPAGEKKGGSLFDRIGLSKGNQPPHDFSPSDLYSLLKRHQPRLRFTADTISDGNQTLVLHYSLDTMVQRCVATLLKQYHPKYGACAAIEPRSGRVLALVSYTRDSEPDLGQNLFARSLFPAASVFKTVTAAAAMEKANMSPDSKLQLAGRRYTLYKFQLKEDLPSSEPISLAEAYSLSINPIFGRIGIYILGASGMREYIDKFGFNRPVPFELENETPCAEISVKDSLLSIAEIASGFNQKTKMSPLFGAMLAATVWENGRMPRPSLVDSLTFSDSCTLYRARPGTCRVPIQQATAASLRGMMSRVVQYGTARNSFKYIRRTSYFDSIQYGGKTGTVDDDRLGKVDWFIGFACHPTDFRQQIAIGVVTVHDQFWTVHSSFVAAEVFRKYIRQVHLLQRAARQEPASGVKRPVG
jgi:penicillin-binding protein A